MSAGYSATPLSKKLGYKSGMRIGVLGAPAGFEKLLGGWPDGAAVRTTLRGGAFDIVHLFAPDRRTFLARYEPCKMALAVDGSLWVSWPKKSSGIVTDITEDVIRDWALEHGLVDVKVCAVDDTWSGLKLVRRLVDR